MTGRRALAAAAVAAAALLAAPAAAPAAGSCGWSAPISGSQVNAFYPDGTATYWIAIVPVPPGGRVEVHGRFPHARYMSLSTYTPATQAIDAIADAELAPDAGSGNPYLPGADRTIARRDYTVRVVDGRLPAAGRAPNTIYTENADGSKSSRATHMAGIELRVYEPDLGRDVTGDAGLPELTLVTAGGRRTVLPACPDLALPDAGLTPALAQASPPAALTGADLLAEDPPRWHKYTNLASMQATVLAAGAAQDAADALTARLDAILPTGGAGENLHNKYVYATFSPALGDVLVLRGALPRTPRTREGQRRMGAGQVRYWSLCTNAIQSSAFACVSDDDVVVDRRRRFTIVVSSAAARPRSATRACGATWLPAGPLAQSILLLRNMLADPGFTQAIQRVRPGRERAQMGAYYPRGRYYATAADADRALRGHCR